MFVCVVSTFTQSFFFCTLLTTADGLQRAIRLELIGYQFYSTYCNVAILLLIIPVVTINITIIKDPFLSSHLSFSLAGFFSRLTIFYRDASSAPYVYCTRYHVFRYESQDTIPALTRIELTTSALIADGPHHYHPACGHKGSSHLSPVHALQFFYRDASSTLLQLVNQWLNFTCSRSHAFRYERKNTNPTLVRIELTTSALAGVQITYY